MQVQDQRGVLHRSRASQMTARVNVPTAAFLGFVLFAATPTHSADLTDPARVAGGDTIKVTGERGRLEGWGRARFGISQTEAQQLFPRARRDTSTDEVLVVEGRRPFGILDMDLSSGTWSADLYFTDEDGLYMVVVKGDVRLGSEPAARLAAATVRFRRLVEALTARWGPPDVVFEGFGKGVSAEMGSALWRFEDAVLHVIGRIGGTNAHWRPVAFYFAAGAFTEEGCPTDPLAFCN